MTDALCDVDTVVDTNVELEVELELELELEMGVEVRVESAEDGETGRFFGIVTEAGDGPAGAFRNTSGNKLGMTA